MRVVTYNVAQLAGNDTAIGNVFQAMVDDETPGFAVAPHVVLLQEVRAADVPTIQGMLAAVEPPGVTYATGTFDAGGEFPGSVALFYRSDVLEEVTAEHIELPTGATRQTDRWTLRLLGSTDPDASFYVYCSHLKAGTSGSDALERQAGVFLIRQDSDDLPDGTLLMYTGDMNISSHNENTYVDLTAAGPGQAVDPLGSGSWGGASNALKHTQSPRLPCGGPLSCGGMDDRFDFVLPSGEWYDGSGFALMTGTLRSLGNDGNHFDQSINDGTNSFYPDDIARSNALADDLFDASDHIPVMIEFRFPGRIGASLSTAIDRIILDTPVPLSLVMENAAPAVVAGGAEIIDFDATASGVLLGAGSGTLVPLAAPANVPLLVDTTVLGVHAGSVVVTSTGEGADDVVLDVQTAVLRPSDASFSSGSDEDSVTVPWVVQADSGIRERTVEVHNFGHDALQALLDIDGVSGGGAPFGFGSGLTSDVGDTPAMLTFTLDTSGLAGPLQSTFFIDVSDEDIPGETADMLTLTLDVTLGEAVPGDLDADGVVTLDDLCLWYLGPVDVDGDLDADDDDAQFIADAAGIAIVDANDDGIHDECQDTLLINEIRVDQTGADNDEYFELSGAPGTSLDGISYLVIGDPGHGTIEEIIDLTGQTIGGSGYFLVSETDDPLGVTADLVLTGNNPINFENGDNVTHLLVSGFTGSNGQDLDTNDDGTLDVTPWTEIVDLIALVEEDNPPTGTEFHYGPPSIGPLGGASPSHVFRCPVDSAWRIGDPDAGVHDTPGAVNDTLLVGDPCPEDAAPCPGDTNDDGFVDVNDLNNVILDWGTDGSANGGDITGTTPGSPPDGAVDVNDLNAVIVGWGNCP